MRNLSLDLQAIRQQFSARRLRRTVGLLALCCLISLCWSVPAYAVVNAKKTEIGDTANPSIEAEILQVIRDHPEVIWEALQNYHQQPQQRQENARSLLLQELRTDPQKIIADSPTIGAVGQRIVLVEFSDFQCPYCAEVHKTLKQFMESHQNEVTLVYKHFPLTSIHPKSIAAAKAAWAAGQQGKFWLYHDALFTQQNELDEKLYLTVARNLNMNLDRFNRDRNSSKADAAIQRDVEMARVLGVRGTPFFVMNAELFSGAVPLSKFEEVLQQIHQQEGK